jgi:hypothetical protein
MGQLGANWFVHEARMGRSGAQCLIGRMAQKLQIAVPTLVLTVVEKLK